MSSGGRTPAAGTALESLILPGAAEAGFALADRPYLSVFVRASACPVEQAELPFAIRSRLRAAPTPELVVWRDPAERRLGFVMHGRALVLHCDRVRAVVIDHQRPAKGAGAVGLTAKTEENGRSEDISVLVAGYTEAALAWLRGQRPVIERLFGVPLTEFDWGYDC